jgi:hypothetical protein
VLANTYRTLVPKTGADASLNHPQLG